MCLDDTLVGVYLVSLYRSQLAHTKRTDTHLFTHTALFFSLFLSLSRACKKHTDTCTRARSWKNNK